MRTKAYQLPIVLAQAVWVALKASRLPEASGPRNGVAGRGPALRVLVLGDSSAAGVGVDTQDQALAGALVTHLSSDFEVHWSVVANSGATAGTLARILEDLPAAQVDVAVIACGVNDTKNGLPRHIWQRNYAQVIDTLQTRFSVSLTIASGLPQVEKFPLLPNPLRQIISDRATLFDNDLQAFAQQNPKVVHLPMDFVDDPTLMAPDKFHPGPLIYKAWGAQAAILIRQRLTQT